MTLSFRNALFVFAGAIAGFLSGFTLPLTYGMRGAILGAAISCGTLFLRPRRHAPIGHIPSLGFTLLLVLAVGALAFTAMHFWHLAVPDEGPNLDFQLPAVSAPARFSICLSFALTLLLFYRERQAGHARAWAWYLASPFLGAIIRASAFHQFDSAPFNFLLGALPFALLWLFAAALIDPAWTQQRWKRYSEHPPAQR